MAASHEPYEDWLLSYFLGADRRAAEMRWPGIAKQTAVIYQHERGYQLQAMDR
jgi:hypothetical protein